MAAKIADVHIFVDEQELELAVAVNPRANEKLWWGKRIAGLRVTLADAKLADVKYLLQSAWQHKAPKRLRDKIGGTR